MTNNYDVIIVGAGFAGVTAARNLSQKGYRTLLLEGRDRIGGRTWYEHRLGEDLEIGGTFIHWFQPNVWHELTRYNLEVERLIEIRHAYWISDGKVHKGTEAEEFARVKQGMTHLAKDSEKYFPLPFEPFHNEEAVKEIDHLSLADGLRAIKDKVGQEIYDILVAYWCAYFTTDDLDIPALTQMYRWVAMSYNDWEVMEDIFELYKFKHGTKSLLESMLDDGTAELRLSTPVSEIEKTDEGYAVKTRTGEEHTAPAVIVAVPLNTLNDIQFSPPLAAEKHQISDEKLTSVKGAKMWAKVRGPSITDTFRLTGPAYPVSSMHTQFFDHETNEAIIMAYVSNYEKVDVMDPADVQRLLRNWLPDIEVIDCTGHVWAEDEFSQGSWAVARTNQLTKYGRAIREPDGGIYLAGSDLANGWSGFIDGAIESGSSTGERVAAYLKEHSST